MTTRQDGLNKFEGQERGSKSFATFGNCCQAESRQLFHPRQGMNFHNFDGRLRNLQMRMALERFGCRFM